MLKIAKAEFLGKSHKKLSYRREAARCFVLLCG